MSHEDGTPSRTGRPRDHSRDEAILDATLEVLAGGGYEALTVDAVAERAKAGKATLYRRWSSKERLILAAIAHMKRTQVDLEALPDTGTLRGDLLALFKPLPPAERTRRLRVMGGVASLLMSHGEMAAAAEEAMVSPWASAHLSLMRRAAERGEIPADADVETLSQIIPSMAAYRSLVQRRAFDLEFLVHMVDVVVLPALHGGARSTTRSG